MGKDVKAQKKGHLRTQSASQGEKPQNKPNLLTPWSWTPSLQNCEKIKFCCWNLPAVVFQAVAWANHGSHPPLMVSEQSQAQAPPDRQGLPDAGSAFSSRLPDLMPPQTRILGCAAFCLPFYAFSSSSAFPYGVPVLFNSFSPSLPQHF